MLTSNYNVNQYLTNVNIFIILKILFTKNQQSIIERGMKTMTIGVRMTPEIKEKLQKIADEEMRSISNLVLKIMTDYLKDYEKNPSKPSK